MRSSRTPKYRRQKRPRSPDEAFVELAGKRHYLGRYDSPESHQRYHQLLAEWNGNANSPRASTDAITIVEVCAHFWEHCVEYYRRPDGTPTSEADNFRQALRVLHQLYGSTRADDFGPNALRAVRQCMIERGWTRKNINNQINRLKHVFKWATGQELIAPRIHQALTCVPGLRAGRGQARENPPIRPVSQGLIAAIKPYVSRQVWALIQLQLLTGARAGELLKLRAIDLKTNGDVWTAALSEHKTAHHGHERTLLFGPQAQIILREFLADRQVDSYLFSPIEAMRERHENAEQHRRPNQIKTPRRSSRTIGCHYTTASYRRAIARACQQANPHPDPNLRARILKDGTVESEQQLRARLKATDREQLSEWRRQHHWHPHQLRHNAATNVRGQFGVEAAQMILGHRRADVTQIYAEVNMRRASEIAAVIG